MVFDQARADAVGLVADHNLDLEEARDYMDDLIAGIAELRRQLTVALEVRDAAIAARDDAVRERDEAH